MRLCVHTLSPRQNASSLPQNMFWYYSRMCCLTTEYPRCLQNVFSLPQNMFSYHRTCSLTVTAICDLSSTYIECVLLPQNMFWYYSRMCCLTTEYPRCLQNVFSYHRTCSLECVLNVFSRTCSLTTEHVLLPQNMFSYHRTCSLTTHSVPSPFLTADS